MDTIARPVGRTFEWTARLNGVLYLLANGADAGPGAASILREMQEDVALKHVMHRAQTWPELEAAVGRFSDRVGTGTDYESLVSQADVAKRLLEDARTVAE